MLFVSTYYLKANLTNIEAAVDSYIMIELYISTSVDACNDGASGDPAEFFTFVFEFYLALLTSPGPLPASQLDTVETSLDLFSTGGIGCLSGSQQLIIGTAAYITCLFQNICNSKANISLCIL